MNEIWLPDFTEFVLTLLFLLDEDERGGLGVMEDSVLFFPLNFCDLICILFIQNGLLAFINKKIKILWKWSIKTSKTLINEYLNNNNQTKYDDN